MKRIFLAMTACAIALCASATVRYVSPTGSNGDGLSWATAYKTIASAMSASTVGDDIYVAAGTYNEKISVKDGVNVLGGYNASTGERNIDQYISIIDGTGIDNYLLVRYLGTGETYPTNPSLIEGLTFQNLVNSQWGGGAIFLRGNMTINRCHIINCKATNGDTSPGAVYVEEDAAPNQPKITNCIIELCEGTKGAAAIYNKTGIIENCIFRGNVGPRAVVRNYKSNSVLRNCLFHNNSTYGSSNKGIAENNGLMMNCTLCNNYSDEYNVYTGSSGKAYNCVYWGNKNAEGFGEGNYISSSSSSSNNVADHGTSSSKFLSVKLAANNFDAAGPNFSNPTSFVGAPTSDAEILAMQHADFSLTAASTALLNNGTTSGAPATDIDGTTRPIGSGIDIGCYEYNPNAATIALTNAQILQDTLWVSIGASGAFAVLYTPANATNKRCNWTIDDTSIATIDNGLVTGVAVGKTIARMESEEGHFTDDAVVVIRPRVYPQEVLDADANYSINDYTVPTFIEFLVAKEEARIDSLTCENMNDITTALAKLSTAISNLKSKYEPYNQIATFYGDPKTHMGFCWFTNGGITNGKVQILAKANASAADFEAGTGVINVDATTTNASLHYTPIQASESPKYDICTAAGLPRDTKFNYVSHKAQATTLTPGTTYSWRVGFDGHWSEIAQFVTQANNQGDFSFLYMSDSHIQDYEYIENANWCAKAAVKNETGINFCVFPGDFADTGGSTNSEWQWEQWFEGSMRPALNKMAFVPTDGNHDDSPSMNYDLHFNTDWGFANAAQTKPQFKGITYSFVYGDVLFLVYSLQDWWRASGSSESSMRSSYITTDLRNWFLEQVAAHPNTKYRVTLSHKNVFSGAGHHKDDESALIRELMLPIMKECEIDLAIQGHDHCYEVIGPVDPDTRQLVDGAISGVESATVNTNTNINGKSGGTFNTDDGTLYFIGATCGRKRYYPSSRSELESEYTTNPSLLFDGNHHNVEGLYDLFSSMFGQPGSPSYSRFNVTSDGIEVKSYKTDASGNSTLYNTIHVVNSKPHTVPTGFEDTRTNDDFRDGEKFIRNGQLFIRIDGKIYNALGQKVD